MLSKSEKSAKTFVALLFYFVVPSFGVIVFWLETILLLVILGSIWYPHLFK